MEDTKRTYGININRLPASQLNFKEFEKTTSLPSSVDLRSKMPPVWDQGQLGACTSFGTAVCFEYADKDAFEPSHLFIYYNERSMEGTINEDSGANISDGIKSLQTYGVCKESSWPYNISKFKVKPSATCYTEALRNRALNVANIRQDLTSMKTCLSNGFPIVLGISVYSSFESQQVANTGVVPMPGAKEKNLGGHCVACVGYNDTTKTWLMRNSWGTSWGMKGYFTLPYMYLLDSNLCSDLWSITSIRPTPKQIPIDV